MSSTPLEILKNTFGYPSFRPGQNDIIKSILNKNNILAIMPTGAGKSICYQIPAIINKEKTIVVSPLVALMDDQVNSLKQNKVYAERVHSNMTNDESEEILKKFYKGIVKILYMSPEALMKESKIKEMQKLDIGLFVIDEAHCISKWGPGFRKDYENLSKLKNFFPKSNIVAFTATADKATREDVMQKLSNSNCKLFLQGFKRPNLSLSVYQKFNWKDQLIKFLKNKKGQSGIIYCLSRKSTEEVAEYLKSQKFKAIAYHAGQDQNTRKENQNSFMTDSGVIIAATIAFGMGIDKPDVRFVFHLSLPSNIESYYQEIGRAGRDGKPSDTMMIYGLDDLFQRRRFIEEENSNEEHKKMEHRRLDALLAYCEASVCRQSALLAYFSDEMHKCRICDNCVNPPKMENGSILAQKVLSAIYRTGQYFGSTYIIDVLRGSKSEKIINNQHNKIKTFGVGKDYQKEFWQSFIRQLISANHIRINIQKFGSYEITGSGMNILKGKIKFKYKSIDLKNIVLAKEYKKNDRIEIEKKQIPLLIKLKKLRLRLAKEQNVPAYVIFSDQTLLHMIEKKPKDIIEMNQVVGMGPNKIQKYGPIFLKELHN